jgi:pyruvate,water dikinase
MGGEVATGPYLGLESDRVLGHDAALCAGVEEIGAKAASLVALEAAGLPVPPFLCVATSTFDHLFARLSPELRVALESLPADNEEIVALSARATTEFRELGLDAGDAERLEELFDATFGRDALVSVRSSATGEDSAQYSFAGQFDTYLYVEREALRDRVVDCFASAFTPRALMYRRVHALGVEAGRMAVAVQLMVPSRVAGVAFTADPSTGDADRIVVSAALGLGTGVVDGIVSADTYVLDASGTIRDRTVEAKASRVALDAGRGSGTVLEDVPSEEAQRPALTDEEAERVGAIARRAAEVRGAPQDVEWAIDPDGGLHLLQSRPITTLGGRDDRELIFDNSNLVESYPELTSPLTFSFMRRFYELAFIEVVRTFGASESMIERDRDVYETLVSLLDGRMYYNLTSWYRMFLQVPGMERALPAFENALGFEQRSQLEVERLGKVERLRWIPLQARLVARLIRTLRRLPRGVEEFEETFRRIEAANSPAEVARLTPHEQLDRIERDHRLLFKKVVISPLNDFYTMQLYALVGHLIGRWELGDPVSTRNELLCGETGMESVDPVRSLVRIAQHVRRDARATALFESDASDGEVWATVEGDSAFDDLRQALRLHVERYGNRSLEELKLETVTLMDDPSPLVAMLRNYLRGGQTVEAMENRERAIRTAAEARVRRRLAGHPLRRVAFAAVLRRCRWGLKTRERVRLTRGRMVGMFRTLFRALAEAFVEHGVLERGDDIFFLTYEEVAAVVRGGSPTRDLRSLVTLRRSEYEAERGRPAASRIATRGIVHGQPLDPPAPPSDGESTLVGIGCSPGRVRARAKVVAAPRADMRVDGEILVASTTDPGWVFLMVAASGLISEKGSVLSHTAIIGRELGIPTVVGVKDATGLIPDESLLELDGRTGTVKLIENGGGS